MAFPGSKSRCSNSKCNVLSMLSSCLQGSHRKFPPPDRTAFTAFAVGFDESALLVFLPLLSTVSSPYLQNLPILPSQQFPSLSILPSHPPVILSPTTFYLLARSPSQVSSPSLYLQLSVHLLQLSLFQGVPLSAPHTR